MIAVCGRWCARRRFFTGRCRKAHWWRRTRRRRWFFTRRCRKSHGWWCARRRRHFWRSDGRRWRGHGLKLLFGLAEGRNRLVIGSRRRSVARAIVRARNRVEARIAAATSASVTQKVRPGRVFSKNAPFALETTAKRRRSGQVERLQFGRRQRGVIGTGRRALAAKRGEPAAAAIASRPHHL